MKVAEWAATGDRQMTMRKIDDFWTFFVASSRTQHPTPELALNYILNPDKRYFVELTADGFILYEGETSDE